MAKKTPPDPAAPDAEAREALLAQTRTFAATPRFTPVLRALGRLVPAPPACLLLEGGSAADRRSAALYWAALLNCTATQRDAKNTPCLACSSCIRFLSGLHQDLFFLDGAAGNIAIDEIRILRGVWGEAPRDAALRVSVIFEAQSLLAPAANALLKSLEEPCPGNVFILTVPQRERILPTLVSRSWTLTLPWPEDGAENPVAEPDLLEWGAALEDFIQSGRNWMPRTSKKGAMSDALAQALLLLVQRSLTQVLKGDKTSLPSLNRLSLKNRRLLYEVLVECQDSLLFKVNPSLVADWIATRIYLMYVQDKGNAAP